MTTIVGIQGDGFAVVGCDTRISSFNESGDAYQISTLGNGSSKIAVNGKYLLGAAGEMRAINILHHVFQPPPPTPGLRGKKLDSFITGKFIPSLRACFDSQGYSPPDSGDSKEHRAEQGSSIVVVINGVIYIIESDYSWTAEANYLYSVGTGSSYALGSLHSLLGNKRPTPTQARSACTKALSVASKFDPYTGAPLQTFVQEAPNRKSSNKDPE
jgi:ATP-dependent protease HslVU (ClpYQ) peptidase subunit